MEAQAYCARCRVVLDVLWTDGTVEWIHPAHRIKEDPSVGDHEPEPVITFDTALLDARTHCDFCDAPSPAWTYPCRSFKVSGGYGSAGDWAACDDCARFIEGKRFKGLAKRSAGDRSLLVPALVTLYQTFDRHRNGPRYRHRP